MYFEDFQEFFDFVTIYRDPAMFKHQSVFHRGRTQPESTPADRARLRKKKTISRPKSSRLLSGSNAGAQEDTVRMISTATEPTALLVTFSAFGSKEKFLDGSSLPPGLLTVSVVHPFGKSTEVRRRLFFLPIFDFLSSCCFWLGLPLHVRSRPHPPTHPCIAGISFPCLRGARLFLGR